MEITRNLPGGWGVGSEAFLESSVRPWNSDYKGPHGLYVTHYRHRHRHHHDHQNIHFHFHCYRSAVRTRDTNLAQACHQSKHIFKFGICDQCRTMSIFDTKDSFQYLVLTVIRDIASMTTVSATRSDYFRCLHPQLRQGPVSYTHLTLPTKA